MKQGLILGTVILLILVIMVWISPLISDQLVNEFNLNSKIIFSVIVFAGLILGWGFYSYQGRLDKNKKKEKGLGKKTFETINKVDSIGLRIRAGFYVVGSLIVLVFGVLLAIFLEGNRLIGIILIILSVLLFFLGRSYLKIAKPRSKGRYY